MTLERVAEMIRAHSLRKRAEWEARMAAGPLPLAKVVPFVKRAA